MNALELKNYVLLLQNEYLSTKCVIFATNLCRKETQTPYKVAIAALLEQAQCSIILPILVNSNIQTIFFGIFHLEISEEILTGTCQVQRHSVI